MKKEVIYKVIAAIAVIIVIGIIFCAKGRMSKLNNEIDRLNVKLAHSMMPPYIQRDTIHDTVKVVSSPVAQVDGSSYKQELADKDLLKDVGVKPGQVTEQHTTGTIIHDTVKFNGLDYKDYWTEFHLSADSTLRYSVRDSVVTIVYKEYKHKFLWWKWGTRGYKTKIINFNPHSEILYNQSIIVEH